MTLPILCSVCQYTLDTLTLTYLNCDPPVYILIGVWWLPSCLDLCSCFISTGRSESWYVLFILVAFFGNYFVVQCPKLKIVVTKNPKKGCVLLTTLGVRLKSASFSKLIKKLIDGGYPLADSPCPHFWTDVNFDWTKSQRCDCRISHMLTSICKKKWDVDLELEEQLRCWPRSRRRNEMAQLLLAHAASAPQPLRTCASNPPCPLR